MCGGDVRRRVAVSDSAAAHVSLFLVVGIFMRVGIVVLWLLNLYMYRCSSSGVSRDVSYRCLYAR